MSNALSVGAKTVKLDFVLFNASTRSGYSLRALASFVVYLLSAMS